MSGKPGDWLASCKEQLTADKKKSVLLGTLFVVFVVVVGRLALSDPEPATASPERVVVPQPVSAGAAKPRVRPSPERASGSGWSFGHANSVPRANPDGRRGKLRLGLEPGAEVRTVSIDGMPRVLERDPFNTTAWALFPPAVALDTSWGLDAKDPGASMPFWWRLGEAIRERQKERQDEENRLETELAALELQSTMTGSVPTAHISGRLMHEGETLRGFLVERIGERFVTVRKDGMVRELTMP